MLGTCGEPAGFLRELWVFLRERWVFLRELWVFLRELWVFGGFGTKI